MGPPLLESQGVVCDRCAVADWTNEWARREEILVTRSIRMDAPRRMLVTAQEIADEKYVRSPTVLKSVKLVNDYVTATQTGKDPEIPRGVAQLHFVTFQNFNNAFTRLQKLYDLRAKNLKRAEEKLKEAARKSADASTRLNAMVEGNARAAKRARGEFVPEATPPQIDDFEVESTTDGEGERRRKTILRKRRGEVEDENELPTAGLWPKEQRRRQAVRDLRAKRAMRS